MVYKSEIDLERHRDVLIDILQDIIRQPALSHRQLDSILRVRLKGSPVFFSCSDLILAYRMFAGSKGLPPFDDSVVERLRLKPIRTSSGLATVTVLTKPYPCPGECIFCPNDVRMPKSYLVGEPGAQRAAENWFDPYLQTYSRLTTLYQMGHPIDKVEIIILGGTWSFYPETYQIWFVKRVFDALHDFGQGIDHTADVEALLREVSQLHPAHPVANVTIDGTRFERTYNQIVQSIYKEEMHRSRDQAAQIAQGQRSRTPVDEFATWEELEAAHRENEDAACRCVGLVVETRPDHISAGEVLRFRRLGCTKVQIGFQSLNDDVLRQNKRGHTVAATRQAVRLLRQAGFKIHAHWMLNLYGSSPAGDVTDFQAMFSDPDFCPDELKIYPCSLVASAELMQRYQEGSWRPYTRAELLHVLTECFLLMPEYCRLTRVVRDIPGTAIVVGNKTTNFRQVVEDELARQGKRSRDIRAREIRQRKVTLDELRLDELWYPSGCSDEVFLQYITADRAIAGFLRLSLPKEPPLVDELIGAAIIREVHVYGQALRIGEESLGRSQHLGLGTRLIERAVDIARSRGYRRLAVISAVGTRAYYRQRGFGDGALYQVRELSS
jgi:elongator complex protein 3